MQLQTPQAYVQFLIERGQSQAAIAKRAGVSQPTISRILSGDHEDPKSSVLINLSRFAEEVAAASPSPAQPESQPQ